MSITESNDLQLGFPEALETMPQDDFSREKIDAYFVISEEHAEGTAAYLWSLSQFEIDQLIHERASQDETHPGLRSEIKNAILNGDKDELSVLGSIATQQAMRGAELKALRDAAKACMENSAKESFHKS